jgi:hypothetical protein
VHGWLIVQSVSVSYGTATADLPVIELLRGYFEVDSRDDPRKIREKVTGKVLTLAPVLGPAVSALLALLDVAVGETTWNALDPLQRRQQTLDAVKRLLLRESEVQLLVALVAEAVEVFRRHQNHVRPAFVFLCAGMSYLSVGRVDEAAGHAGEALTLSHRLGARASEAHASSTSPARSRRRAGPRTPRPATARRWHSPASSACARSWPTAISASASSTAAVGTA